jgi:hypothetical protein
MTKFDEDISCRRKLILREGPRVGSPGGRNQARPGKTPGESAKGVNMRTALIADSSIILMHARTPGVILLARAIKDVARRCGALKGEDSATRIGSAAGMQGSRCSNSEVRDSETIRDEAEQL